MSEGLTRGRWRTLTLTRLRLVMPPVLFAVLSYPFTQLGHFLFPTPWANCIIAGSFNYCACTLSIRSRCFLTKI